MIEVTARRQFVGTPSTVAAAIDEFVDEVVPHLQERGVFRTEYAGPTLREQLF